MQEYGSLQDWALCFDDILLVPQHSKVESRRNVDLSMNIGDREILSLPVISSPMDTVTGYEMAAAMAKAGGLGIIPRFVSVDKQATEVTRAKFSAFAVGAAVGSSGDFIERAQELYRRGASLILVDTANGHNQMTIDAVYKLRAELPDIHLMAGNVSTYAGWRDLSDAGADSVRVGIGGGSCCTTRIVSGHGIPTLASIMDIAKSRRLREEQNRPFARIIADGGIKSTGDMVKAFAAGADAVMLGSMLAGHDECPGGTDEQGRKSFRGMASAAAQDAAGARSVVEGIATTVNSRGSVQHTLESIRGGLGSGCSYSGVNALRELRGNAFFVRVGTGSLAESNPHALQR